MQRTERSESFMSQDQSSMTDNDGCVVADETTQVDLEMQILRLTSWAVSELLDISMSKMYSVGWSNKLLESFSQIEICSGARPKHYLSFQIRNSSALPSTDSSSQDLDLATNRPISRRSLPHHL